MGKLFGTDGIRGPANQHPMTGEVAMAVGRAVTQVLMTHPEYLPQARTARRSRKIRIVVGKDTRLSGYMIEMALASGICSMGGDVILIGPLSTPGVAFVTQSMRADAGVMISASHNPYYDNGIKIFSADGYKLPDVVESEIEKLVTQNSVSHRPTHDKVGKAFRIDDVFGRYVVYLKTTFPNNYDLTRFRIALDCANGAAYKAAPLVFEELGAEVVKTGVAPNGLNINDACGALYPEEIGKTTVQFRADVGISLDGDGDRCILSDENGEIVDGDQILGLCAIQMAKDGMLNRNTLVATPMSNYGLDLSLRGHGISVVRAPVGDRYVVEKMRTEGYNLGGEQSGHLIFLDHATTGDGIIGALKVLEVMLKTGKPLSELKKQVRLMPQVQRSVRVAKKEPFENFSDISKAIESAQNTLKNEGRVFVRYSGTEPLARIMVEGEDAPEITRLGDAIAEAIQKHLGA